MQHTTGAHNNKWGAMADDALVQIAREQRLAGTAACCCGVCVVVSCEFDAPQDCNVCRTVLARDAESGAILVVRCLCHAPHGAPPQQPPSSGNTKWTAPPHWVQCQECKCFSHGSCYQRFNHTKPGALTINGTQLAARGFTCAFCKKAKNVSYECALCACFRASKLIEIKTHSYEQHQRTGIAASRSWRTLTPDEAGQCPQCQFRDTMYQVNSHFQLVHGPNGAKRPRIALPPPREPEAPLRDWGGPQGSLEAANQHALPAEPEAPCASPPAALEAANQHALPAEPEAEPLASDEPCTVFRVQVGQIVGNIQSDTGEFKIGTAADVSQQHCWSFERVCALQKALERTKDIADRVTVACDELATVSFVSEHGSVKCTLATGGGQLTIADGTHARQRFPADALSDVAAVVRRAVLLKQVLE